MTLEEKLYVHKVEDALKRMEENFNSLQLLQTKIAELANEAFNSFGNDVPLCTLDFYKKLRQLTVVQ